MYIIYIYESTNLRRCLSRSPKSWYPDGTQIDSECFIAEMANPPSEMFVGLDSPHASHIPEEPQNSASFVHQKKSLSQDFHRFPESSARCQSSGSFQSSFSEHSYRPAHGNPAAAQHNTEVNTEVSSSRGKPAR